MLGKLPNVVVLAFVSGLAAGGAAAGERSGRLQRVEHVRPEMVLVPAGAFTMGVDEEESSQLMSSCVAELGIAERVCDNQLLNGTMLIGERVVFLSAFEIDRHEVTAGQYRACIAAGRCDMLPLVTGPRPLFRDELPIVNVTWQDAVSYCRWRGKRLPSEAEWEKAARGRDGRKYPWGKVEPTAAHANFGRTITGTQPVQSSPDGASSYGILDLAGNAGEWCEDVDDPTFYLSGPERNPRNTVQPQAGAAEAPRVVRGGGWMFDAHSLRTFSRSSFAADFRLDVVGFRCAL